MILWTIDEPRERAALAVVVGLCVVKAALHLALVHRYGYHGDELYFVECGRRLAFGYVDHPPLVPWLARAADALGGGLLLLRLPAIVAGVGTMAFTALVVREWGGGARAQLLALLALLVAPAHLRMGAMLDIPVVEGFLCAAAAWCVVRARARGEPRWWVPAGVALGLAVLTKHDAAAWAAALAVGLAAEDRRALASPWPWVGAAIAATFAAPNLWWQVQHGLPSLEFYRTLQAEVAVTQGRVLFVAGQLLYFHPLAAPLWVAGLWWGGTREGAAARPFVVQFGVLFLALLAAGGKPYYLATAYPPVLAAGAVWAERAFARGIGALAAALAVSGAALAVLTLPVLPIRSVDRAVGALLGWAVPPIGLTHDLHGMLGWDVHVAAVGEVYQGLPPSERANATLVAGTYAQASAVNVLGASDLPQVVSGHLSYHLWGPDPVRGDVAVAWGVPLEHLRTRYSDCSVAGRVLAPLARPSDADLPVYVCRHPLSSMEEWWPALKAYGHLP